MSLPTALLLRVRWPSAGDWLAVVALGLCFFGLFFAPVQYCGELHDGGARKPRPFNFPLQTMVVGALLGIEPLTKTKNRRGLHRDLWRFSALASGLAAASTREPGGADLADDWRGTMYGVL